MGEKIPGKGFVMAGAIVLLIAGAMLLYSGITQIPQIKELINNDLLPDSVRSILNASLILDPLRGVLGLAGAASAVLCFMAPRKWNMLSMITAILVAVAEFAGIILYSVAERELGGTGKISYSVGLLGAVLVLVGLGRIKTKLREESRASA